MNASPPRPPAYEVDRLSFAYGSAPVLQEVRLSLAAGGFGALLGPNGSGKSTLLRLLVGRLRPSAGSIRLAGQALDRLKPAVRARIVGYLPQEIHAAYPFTVAEVVLMGRYPHLSFGLESHRDVETAARCMERTATAHLAERPFSTLSGGEKQRVLLASVLAQEPEVLLLDEPTAALDLHHQHEVMGLLSDLHRDGLAILMVTHDLNLASRYCPLLWLLHQGRVIAEGTPEQVIAPAVLGTVYGDRFRIVRDPDLGRPLVLPPAPESAPCG